MKIVLLCENKEEEKKSKTFKMSKKLRVLFIISYLSIQLTSGHNYTKILNFKFNKANTYLVFENLNFWQPWS